MSGDGSGEVCVGAGKDRFNWSWMRLWRLARSILTIVLVRSCSVMVYSFMISSRRCCASLRSLSKVSLSSIFPRRRLTSPTYPGVCHICDHLVDQELLGGTSSELPPLSCGHGGVVAGLSTDVDWDGVLGVALAFSASEIHIVGVILYVFGDLGAAFFVPLPIHGIWDMDGVEMSAFKLIVNEACRCRVRVFHHTTVVDAANPVFLDWN